MIEDRVRILLLDDDKSFTDLLKEYLESEFGYCVIEANNSDEAEKLIDDVSSNYDVVLIDQHLGAERDGIEVMKSIKARHPALEVIIFTTLDGADRRHALEAGAFRFLSKPINNDELATLIRLAAQHRWLRRIGSLIWSQREPEQVLQEIINTAQSLALADEVSIVTIEEDSGRLLFHPKMDYSPLTWTQHFKSRQLTKEIIDTGQVESVQDTIKDTSINPELIESKIRSFSGVPIPGKDRNLGVLYVYSKKPHQFEDWAVANLLRALAAQAGLAMSNANAFQYIQNQANTMDALVHVGTDLNQTEGIKNKLHLAWEFVQRQFSVETFYIGILDESSNSLHFPISYDRKKLWPIKPRPLNGQSRNPGLVEHVVNTGEELFWPTHQMGVEKCEGKGIHITVGGSGIPCETCLLLPLTVGEVILGVASIQSYRKNAFSTIVRNACRTLGSQLAIAIANADLLQGAKKTAERFRVLYEASNTLVSFNHPDQILRDTVELAKETTEAVSVSLVLIDDSFNIRELESVGVDKGKGISEIIRPDGLSRKVWKSGNPEVIRNVANEGKRANPSLVERGISSACCVCLELEGKEIGVMWFHFNEPRKFTAPEIDAFRLYANQASIAYASARRIRELEHMRKASAALSGADDLRDVLQEIVEGAREVLAADSTAIWSYDPARDAFSSEGSVADGIRNSLWRRFIREEPRRGQTAFTVMAKGWVGVEDVPDRNTYPFLGKTTQKLLEDVGVNSFQGISLEVAGEILGVLYVNYNKKRRFSEEEKITAIAFANHAALALKKVRLLDQLEKSHDASRAVARSTAGGDLESTLESIVRETQRVIGCDVISIFWYDPDKKEIGYPPVVYGARYPEKIKTEEIRTSSLVRRFLDQESIEPYVAPDAKDDPGLYGPFVDREDIVSAAAVCLVAKKRKVGVMFVNFRRHHELRDEEMVNIQLFADHAASAVFNALLYKQAHRRARVLEALHDAGRVISADSSDLQSDLDRLAKRVFDITANVKEGVTFANIRLVEDDNTRFVAAYPRDELLEIWSEFGVNISLKQGKDGKIGITGRAIDSGMTQIVDNVIDDADYIPTHNDTHSVIAVPIKSGGTVWGVINIEHPEINAFSGFNYQPLETIAANAAYVISNAQQHEAIQEKQDLVVARTAVAWMGMASSTWLHSIHNHATTIRDLAELLRQDLSDGVDTDQLLQRLVRIDNMAEKIQTTPITAPPTTDADVTSLNINDLIRERISRLSKHEPYKRIYYDYDFALSNEYSIRASSRYMTAALGIVIENAVESMVDAKYRHLKIKTFRDNGDACVLIIDSGGGIPEEVQKQLFRGRVEKEPGEKGLGMGLLIAHTIVQYYGGDIVVESTGPEGTRMLIRIPIENESEGK